MIRKPLFIELFLLLFVAGILNFIAQKFYLYWSIKEFDSLIHFLGGAFVSFVFLWLFFYSGLFNPKDRSLKNFLLVSTLSVILVGILWENYELLIGATDVNELEYPFDTSLDIVMDTLGSLSACLYAYIKEINISMIPLNTNISTNEPSPE